MNWGHPERGKVLLLVGDLVLAGAAAIFATSIDPVNYSAFVQRMGEIGLFMLVFSTCFYVFDLYDVRALNGARTITRLLAAAVLGICILSFFLFFFQWTGFSRISMAISVSMLLVGTLNSQPAQSQELKAGDLVISQPWSRAAPRGAETAVSYLTIENKGTTPDRLVGGSAEYAEKLVVQQFSMAGGGTTESPVDGGLAIAPGDKVVLAPGGYHLTLTNLKSAMKKGSKSPITLEFEKAGKVTVSFDVLAASSKGPVAPKASPASDDKMKK